MIEIDAFVAAIALVMLAGGWWFYLDCSRTLAAHQKVVERYEAIFDRWAARELETNDELLNYLKSTRAGK